MATPFYPPLSRLIGASAIPGDFQGVEDLAQDGIDLILGKVFYKGIGIILEIIMLEQTL